MPLMGGGTNSTAWSVPCSSFGSRDQSQPRRRLTAQHYFKSQAEMATLFADLPEALSNTVEIAKRCAFMAYRRDPILPKFADDEVAAARAIPAGKCAFEPAAAAATADEADPTAGERVRPEHLYRNVGM